MAGMRIRQASSALALLAMTTAADINPSNASTAISNFSGHIRIQTSEGQNLTTLLPLTRDAVLRNSGPLKGNLFHLTPDTFNNISNEDVAYLSCNPDSYNGNLDAVSLFDNAMSQRNLTSIVLYSTASDYCEYTSDDSNSQEFPVYSMTSSRSSQRLLDSVNDPAPSSKYFVTIARDGDDSVGGTGNQPQENPLGPSPSTAVAMIILYSITGIITALFLVIIVTGAVRAHRHPDRYGPRDVLGRPRQSRARGLGRAILDTLPIVKFGEREPPKPTDVELGSTGENNNSNTNSETNANGDEVRREEAQSPPITEARGAVDGTAETSREPAAAPHANQESGIAAAAATAQPSSENSHAEEGLGCSICTDDFEKGQDIRVLPCDHKFHPECVDPWLLNVSGTCPLCRVDLRPTTSHDSAGSNPEDGDTLAPPLQPEAATSNNRRSMLRDVLSLRSRPNASAEERISALRRLREQRRNMGDIAGNGSENGSSEDVAAQRRSKRISTRLMDALGGGRARTRGHGMAEDVGAPTSTSTAAAQNGEASTTPAVQQPPAEPTVPEAPERETRNTSNPDDQARRS